MKRKTKTILISSLLICLFMISFSLGTKAAAPPIMTVDYSNEIEVQNLPIRVSVNFDWDDEAFFNQQLLRYVYLDWDVQKNVVAGAYREEYSYLDPGAVARPTIVLLTIPRAGLDENHTVYFEITYEYLRGGDLTEVPPSKTYKVEIFLEGGIAEAEQADLIVYIVLGGAAAIVLIAFAVIYTKKRWR